MKARAALPWILLLAVLSLASTNLLNLATQVKGVLPTANGGTNSSTNPFVATLMQSGNPVSTGQGGYGQVEFARPVAFTRIFCDVDQGSVSINYEQRAESAANTSGTPILSSSLVCVPGGAATTSIAVPNLAADTLLVLTIQAVTGSPTVIRAHATGQPNP